MVVDLDEIRRIPQDVGMEFPYYISLGSLNPEFIHHEFFRIDTTRYFVREYFKGNFSPGKNVKSFGEEVVDKKVSDTAVLDLIDPVCGDWVPFYLAAEHLLKKDGDWREYENGSSDFGFLEREFIWTIKKREFGNVCCPSMKIRFYCGEIDYRKDSTKSIYVDNGIQGKVTTRFKKNYCRRR